MRTLGRYELLRPLARGGMAEVYLARRRVAGVEKRLVIKRLRRERTADPRFLDLFVKEAQLSMSLVQQNIVPVFDFGRAGDDVFLAMEHIDGKDLGSSLAQARGAAMPPLVAAFVAAECCHALDYAHRAHRDARRGAGGGSVVHRDVTPRNVLLSWAGEVKLADFGIAAAMGGGEGALAGTPGYMAPEQARGEPLDARADLYSLGLVLWEMLTGARVRTAGERAELLEAARKNQLPPLPDGVAPELAAILRDATAATPEARLPSAQAMADQLDTFMVAERARTAGAPPARQLATWLAARWANAPDDSFGDAGAAVVDGAAPAAVTFLDDGAAGVLGSETMRSMAMTAPPESGSGNSGALGDEEDNSEPLREEPAQPSAPSASSSSASAPSTGLAVPAAPRRAGRGLALLGGALAAGLGAVPVYRALFSDRAAAPAAETPVADRAAVAPVTAVEPVLPAPVSPSASPALAAAPAAAPSSPASASVSSPLPAAPAPSPPAASPRPRPSPHSPTPPPSSPPAPAASARRTFTIGARPWAHFTIDGGEQRYETPAAVELALGSHRVRFENPTLGVVQEVTITVTADGPASHLQKLQ